MCAQLSQGDRGPPALIDTIHKLDLGERNQIVYTKYTQIQNTKVQKVTLLCAELSQGVGGPPALISTITLHNQQIRPGKLCIQNTQTYKTHKKRNTKILSTIGNTYVSSTVTR